MDQATVTPLCGVGKAVRCSNSPHPNAQMRVEAPMHAPTERRRPLGMALEVTVFRLRCQLRRSGYGSGHCPATAWCHKIGQILKLTPPERTDAYGSSDVHADRAPSATRYGAQSNGISVTLSAEAVGSWIRRLTYHRVVSGNV